MNNSQTYSDVQAAQREAIDAVNRLTIVSANYEHENNRKQEPPIIKYTIRFYPVERVIKDKPRRGHLINSIIEYIKEKDSLVTTEQIFQYLRANGFGDTKPELLRQQIKDRFTKDKKKVFKAFVSFQLQSTNKYLYGLREFVNDNGDIKPEYREKIKGLTPLNLIRKPPPH